MWKYFDKEQYKKTLISFNLINNDWDDKKKIKCLLAVANNTMNHYRKFYISKKNGSKRELLEPDYLLKNIQINILRNILEERQVSKYATAYYKKSSIVNNALPHKNKKVILKLDIHDFFDNISFSMVQKNVFSESYFPKSVGTLLTSLCCYDDCLPQGAPTSAYISNLVMKNFDEHIGSWCNKQNISYTRYCDDMTFSGDFNVTSVIKKVKNFLDKMGFELNSKKTKILKNGQSQIVTGITVNNKIQVPKRYRKKIRQEVYYVKKYKMNAKQINNQDINKYLNELLGKINFILYVNSNDKEFIAARQEIKKLTKIS